MYHQDAFISGYNDAFLPQELGKDQLQPIWMDFNAVGCLGKRISNASLLNVLKLQMQIYSSFSLKLQAPTRVSLKTNTKILKGFGSRGRASLALSLIWSSQQLKKCMFFISPILQRGRKEYWVVKSLSQSHTLNKWQSQDSNSEVLMSNVSCLTCLFSAVSLLLHFLPLNLFLAALLNLWVISGVPTPVWGKVFSIFILL